MKVALCFSGQPRSVQETFPYIEEHILRPFNPDVFTHVWFDNSWIGKRIVSAGGVVATNPIPEDVISVIQELYTPKRMLVDSPRDFDDRDYDSRKYPQIKPKNSLSQRFSVQQAFNLIDDTYDVVIRMRFDWAIQTTIELPPTFRKIFLPNDCPHVDGVNDQFAIGPMNLMKIYCHLYDNIDRLFYNDGVVFCDEILLYNHLRQYNVPMHMMPISYHLQRADNSEYTRIHDAEII